MRLTGTQMESLSENTGPAGDDGSHARVGSRGPGPESGERQSPPKMPLVGRNG